MVKVQCKIFSWCQYTLRKVWVAYSLIKLILLSLFYNEFADRCYISEACMEPMLWFIDCFTKILGPVCVVAVILLTSSIIIISYAVGFTFYLQQNIFIFLLAFFIGHWLLLNIVFYYYMAYVTDPGYPPQGTMITDSVSICKRCIAPKPPRTHHCIVCNRCILKMDHHCPWLDNCIGHFNHRYFFMFCAYAWIGVLFCILFGLPIFYNHCWGKSEYSFSPYLTSLMKSIVDLVRMKPQTSQETTKFSFHTNLINSSDEWASTLYHSCIVYAGLLCVAVLCVLGGFLAWHAILISNGETSIESHINRKVRKKHLKEGKVYKNPFDFGVTNNWKIFLRVDCFGTWWHVLLPYSDAPVGNGIQWKLSTSEEPEINCMIKML